jgi:hypothetical protein
VRFSRALEADVIDNITRDRDICVVFPAAMYKADGSIPVHRDNVSMLMHRYLYVQLLNELDRKMYLLPNCDTKGCMNPFHRKLATRPHGTRSRRACPNGHKYTPATSLPGRDRCKTCRDARMARRRSSGIYPRPNLCAVGHKLTADNVYVNTDPAGRIHRRCRRCTLDRVRATRATAAHLKLNGETP